MSTQQPEGAPALRPSQDPARKEVLTVTRFVPQTRQTEMKVFEMRRDAQTKLEALEPLTTETDIKEVYSPLLEAFAIGFLGGFR